MNFDDYDGVVFDLDGTLVRLSVDWDAAAADVVAVYEDAGIDANGRDLWELLAAAGDHGIGDRVEATLSDHEVAGVDDSYTCPAAEELVALDRPAGVCSLNCEAACHRSLERHDLDTHVDAVVGRDSVANQKPHPEPLLTSVERLGLDPDGVVFVGDSETDAETARNAGIDYQYVGDGPSDF